MTHAEAHPKGIQNVHGLGVEKYAIPILLVETICLDYVEYQKTRNDDQFRNSALRTIKRKREHLF